MELSSLEFTTNIKVNEMSLVLIYCSLLIAGLFVSQNLGSENVAGIDSGEIINAFLMICLSYIMMEVGAEFGSNKKGSRCVKDYLIAVATAALPWLLCCGYFVIAIGAKWEEALFVSRFASPTSSGILFPMLSSVGLAKTWFYRKAYLHTIFDDLDSILFMIPLQVMMIGFRPAILAIIFWIFFCIYLAYKYMHKIKIPLNSGYMLMYSVVIWLITALLDFALDVNFEALLPAFCFGCMINPEGYEDLVTHSSSYSHFNLEKCIKCIFMFFVGVSLPQLNVETLSFWSTAFHVFLLTLVMNVGKCVPIFFYSKEADIKERMALSIATFPRGEVGAGILAISMMYSKNLYMVQIAGLCLGVNFILTGAFISLIKILTKHKVV